jgi:hypothetical protein
MHPFAFRFKRQFVRYRIQNPEVLKGSIGPLRDSFELVTLGRGGAGFLSSMEGKELSPPARLTCHFYSPQMDPPYLTVEADLLYSINNKTSGSQEKTYYGVEFVDKDHPHILKLVDVLKKLLSDGSVVVDQFS